MEQPCIEQIAAGSGWAKLAGGRVWHRYGQTGKSFCSKSFLPEGTVLLNRCPAGAQQQCPRCRMERTRSPWRTPSGRPPAPRAITNSHKNGNHPPGTAPAVLSEIELVSVICRTVPYVAVRDGLLVRVPYPNDYRRLCVAELRERRVREAEQWLADRPARLHKQRQETARQTGRKPDELEDDDGD